MSERDTEQTGGSDQSSDLFSFIRSSAFQAENDPTLVKLIESDLPVVRTEDGVQENVDQAALTQETAPGVTSQQQADGVSTTQAGTEPSQEPANDEALRLQQRIQELEDGLGKRDAAIALIADQARKREEDLFNRSLETMTPDEQEQAKTARKYEQMEAENAFLRTQGERRQQAEAESQDRIDKTNAVYKVIDRLGLPANDPFVVQALMDSQSPAQLVAVARQLVTVQRTVQQQVAAAQAQGVPNVAHAAGGETAPVTPPKRTEQRTGNLVDMMRERQYTSEQVGP